MKRAFFRSLGVIFLALAAYVGYTVVQALRYYNIEGSIHAEFYPLIVALDRFCEKNQEAPGELQDLVPNYLDAIPSSGRVSEINYLHVPGEAAWRFTLVSEATGELRHYIAESGIPLTELERKDWVLEYHDRWNVLEPGE